MQVSVFSPCFTTLTSDDLATFFDSFHLPWWPYKLLVGCKWRLSNHEVWTARGFHSFTLRAELNFTPTQLNTLKVVRKEFINLDWAAPFFNLYGNFVLLMHYPTANLWYISNFKCIIPMWLVIVFSLTIVVLTALANNDVVSLASLHLAGDREVPRVFLHPCKGARLDKVQIHVATRKWCVSNLIMSVSWTTLENKRLKRFPS